MSQPRICLHSAPATRRTEQTPIGRSMNRLELGFECNFGSVLLRSERPESPFEGKTKPNAENHE